jgi:hypothetical protein
MSKFKEAKVVMLPTNKPSKLGDLATYQGKSLAKVIKEGVNLKNTTVQFWNLYIISDDKIKVGAWVINKWNEIHQITKNDGEEYIKTCKKIITTTDTSLKIDNPNYDIGRLAYINLPQPSQQFIEKFIEEYNRGNVITDVLIEYELISNEEYFGNTVNPDNDVPYFDEKLKINPKDNTITIKKVKDSYTREEVVKLLIDCCGEVSGEDGKLLGKSPEQLYNWIKENL